VTDGTDSAAFEPLLNAAYLYADGRKAGLSEEELEGWRREVAALRRCRTPVRRSMIAMEILRHLERGNFRTGYDSMEGRSGPRTVRQRERQIRISFSKSGVLAQPSTK
jgi:hypothetical protein